MNEEEFWEYKRIMATGFTSQEAELLDNFGEHCFETIEAGNRIHLPDGLLLEAIEEYGDVQLSFETPEDDGRGTE